MRWLRLLSLFATASSAIAASFTWSGGAGDGVYSNPANWSGGVVPPNDGTATLVFGDTGAGAIRLNSSINVSQIRFENSAARTYTFSSGLGALVTLQDGLSSSSAGGNNVFTSSVGIRLTDAVSFDLGNGSLEVDGSIVGTGSITKTGAGNLKLIGFNTWTGGLTQTAGTVSLGGSATLGLGVVHFAGGEFVTTARDDSLVFNPITIDAPTTFSGVRDHFTVFAGPVTLNASAALNTQGAQAIFFTGPITESGGSRQLIVTGLTPVVLTGESNFTGGTRVDNGALVFGTAQSVPSTGPINASSLGYVGIGFTNDVQKTILDRLNGSDFRGMIGFDTAPWQGAPKEFHENIDVSDIANYASIGSLTAARLEGEVKVQQGADYRFGGGGGTLYIEGNLTARGNNLQVVSPFGQPLTLVLRANNTYMGATNVLYSVLVLDRENTLPQSSALNLTGPGYVGYTENASLTPNAFLGRIGSIASADAIAGIDSADTNAPRTITQAIDLSLGGTRTDPYYLGTSSKVIITGSITPTIGDALYLTAVKGGQLIVRSQLGSNIPGLVVGQSHSFDPQGGVVELSGANTYTGGTQVRGGTLRAASSSALGLGGVTVNDGGTLDVGAGVRLTNSIALDSGARLSGTGTLASPNGITIGSGAILSPGGLNHVGTLTFNTTLTFASSGVLEFDVSSIPTTGRSADFLLVNGTLNLTATDTSPFTINLYSLGSDGTPGALPGFNANQSYTWQLGFANSITGFNASQFTFNTSGFLNNTNGGSFFVSQSGNSLVINFTPVPEPSTYALFALGLALLALAEYRRR